MSMDNDNAAARVQMKLPEPHLSPLERRRAAQYAFMRFDTSAF
jgi:hypothetical protein